ncbi:MAG: translocation/assembly module TamB domain-containing protein, partial [Lysobacter sp.]
LDAQQGKLHVERLTIDSDRGRFTGHGDYEPRDEFRTNLTATAVFPATAGRTPARLGFVAKGDLARMDVALSGAAPGPVRATLTLRGQEHPRWRLHARADALDVGLLTAPGAPPAETPLALTFEADGVGGNANLRGQFSQGDFKATVLPSKVQIQDQILQVQPLSLQLFYGVATLRGRADFTLPEDAKYRFAVNARGLRWGGTPTAAASSAATMSWIGADADLGFAGTRKAWAAIGRATLTREDQKATVQFDGRGNDQRMALKTLRATMPTGTLDAKGDVAWKPKLQWRLDATLAGFDPGYFATGWNGAVNGKLATTGIARASTGTGAAVGGFDADLAVTELGGRLRGRPLGGGGAFAVRGDAYSGNVALSLGNSRVDAKGTVAKTIDIDAKFAPLHLDDLLPDAAGTLRGTLKLTGARTAPNVDADLNGDGLRYGGYRAATL